MTSEHAGEQDHSRRRTVATGTIILVYALVDAWLLGPFVAIAAALTNALVVFGATAILVTLVNIVACSWIDHRWDAFSLASSGRVEARLERLRQGRFGDRIVGWSTSGSAVTFGIASIVMNAVIVVGAARIFGGRSVGRRRVLVASVSYGLAFAALFSFVGWVVGAIAFRLA